MQTKIWHNNKRDNNIKNSSMCVKLPPNSLHKNIMTGKNQV